MKHPFAAAVLLMVAIVTLTDPAVVWWWERVVSILLALGCLMLREIMRDEK